MLPPQIPGITTSSGASDDLEHRSPILLDLAWAIHDFQNSEVDLVAVIELYESYRQCFEEVRTSTGNFFDGASPEDLPEQDREDLAKADELFLEGESLFEDYFERVETLSKLQDYPDPAFLFKALRFWLECNQRLSRALLYLSGGSGALASVVSQN
jgi:hypothetical protein